MLRVRQIYHWILMLTFVIFIAEAGSFFTMSILQNQLYSLYDVEVARQRIILQEGLVPAVEKPDISASFGDESTSLHPYLGFSLTPRIDAQNDSGAVTADQLGFSVHGGSVMRSKNPDTVIIGIVGGSVAHNFGVGNGSALLAEALQKDERFSKKIFRFTTMALGGYKEPQHLFALNYLLTLGAEFDIVIDLSGFNEVTLPFHENIPAGLHPLYPRSWHLLAGHLSSRNLARIGRIAWLRQFRSDCARWSRWGVCDASYTCALAWHLVDHGIARGILSANVALTIPDNEDGTFVDPMFAGPPYGRSSTGAALKEIVASWKNSSQLMQELGRAHGFRTFTFLQPSPYYGGKPLSPEEKNILVPGNWSDIHSGRGYPLLQDAVKDLENSGFDAIDLSNVFQNYPESLYVDSCCHVGARGNEILAEAIAKEILERW